MRNLFTAFLILFVFGICSIANAQFGGLGAFGEANSSTSADGGGWNSTTTSTTTDLDVVISGDLTVEGTLDVKGTGNTGIGTSVPDAKLQVVSTSTVPTEPMFDVDSTIYTGGLTVLANGNVGIGSTSPIGLFTVKGATATTYLSGHEFLFTRAAANYFRATSSAGSLQFGGGNVDGALTISSLNNVGVGSTVPAAKLDIKGADALSTSKAFNVQDSTGATSLTVLGDGKVGIGTSAPSDILTLKTGGIKLLDTASYLYSESAGDFSIGKNTAGRNLRIISGSAEAIRVASSGNVGIGTTVPVSKLDVAGTITTQGINISGTGSTTLADLTVSGATTLGTMGVSGQATFAGNVGIGSTSPTANLVVSGDTTMPNINITARTGVGQVPQLRLQRGDATDIYTDWTVANSSGNLEIRASVSGGADVEQARFTTSGATLKGTTTVVEGNLGIGTTVAQQKLRVEGNMMVTGITAGGAICKNASGVFTKCTSAVDASGNCTCP